MNPITFGSLFAGIGGIDLGFERCGMECRWQVEINDYAQKVLAKHWPAVHRERDIRECSARNLDWVDVIAGGFPCQDISYAGLGAGLDGERSGLFFEAIRLVRELQPRAVVLENVAALLTRGLDRVLGTLAEIGYDAEWRCIPAAYVGAPHIRDRVFVLAYAESERRREAGRCCERQAKRISVGSEVLADSQSDGRNQRKQDYPGRGEGVRKGEERRSGRGGEASAYANSERLEKRQGQDTIGAGQDGRPELGRSEWWAVEPDVGRVAHGVSNRVDRLRGLGNAVVPQVAEFVGKMVLQRLGSGKSDILAPVIVKPLDGG
jgi:DNA (cytosine-5)-methyltransferase 1